VTNKTAANRYARAVFDVALAEQADLQAIEQQLVAFADLFTQNAALSKILLNPAVPAPRKAAAVALIVKSAKPLPVVAKLIVLLAERDRLVLLPDIVTAYRDRLLDHQNVVRAEITSAAPLAADRAQLIERAIADLTGRRVRLSTHVEPALIGGLVAKVGGTVYDGSVTMQLKKMKQRLTEGIG
jgi:F-type H+-transporting ATPase subunit delta